ncbi:MAG: WD40 repeat domain-containing protein [Nostoc sp. ChiQUE01a]|nr:WD40 repeat domain-containing protein [Nostoc sp. ChiQUE01a]
MKFKEFKAHSDIAYSVSFSPDGKLLATASRKENEAFLWKLSGEKIAEFKGHADIINRVSFSPNGQFIATASFDKTSRLWNLSGKMVAELKGHENRVNDVNFSPNSDLIATASSDNTVRLWNLSGQEIRKLTGGVHSIFSVNFRPGSQQLVTGGGDGKVRFWNLSGEQLSELKVSPYLVVSTTFSPDGKLLATAENNNMIRLFDLSGTKTTNEFDLLTDRTVNFIRNPQIVESVSFSPNGKIVATSGIDNTIKLWNLNGRQVEEFKLGQNNSKLKTRDGIDNRPRNDINWISFSPDGKMLAAACNDGMIRLFVVDNPIRFS